MEPLSDMKTSSIPDGTASKRKQTSISASVVGDVAVVAVCGRLVHGEGAAPAMQRLIQSCAASQITSVVVNVAEVHEMDAAGISALVVIYSAAKSIGAEFRLTGLSARISYLLSLTGLEALLHEAQYRLPFFEDQERVSKGPHRETSAPSSDAKPGCKEA